MDDCIVSHPASEQDIMDDCIVSHPASEQDIILCPALKPDGTLCNRPYSAHLSAPKQQLPGNYLL